MAVTRYVYTDATFLTFTLGANTKPSTTEAANIITSLYKDCYKVGYGNLTKYNATDTNISDGILEAWFDIVDHAFMRIIEEISDYYSDPSRPKPDIHLNESEKQEVIMSVGLGYRFPSREDPPLDEVGDTID